MRKWIQWIVIFLLVIWFGISYSELQDRIVYLEHQDRFKDRRIRDVEDTVSDVDSRAYDLESRISDTEYALEPLKDDVSDLCGQLDIC